jgi:hypothetical protein
MIIVLPLFLLVFIIVAMILVMVNNISIPSSTIVLVRDISPLSLVGYLFVVAFIFPIFLCGRWIGQISTV